MPKRLFIVKTPDLCEYIFNVMASTPKNVISRLTTQEMAYFKDHRSMRRFADKETLEKSLQLLSRIEVPFFVAIGKRDPLITLFKDIPRQYDSIEKRKIIIESMAQNKVFVFSSNDVLLYGHMAAQNSHSRVYILNPIYTKLYQKISEQAQKQIHSDPSNVGVKDSADCFDMMSTAILQSLIKIDHSEAMAGVTMEEMKILLAIFRYRHTFISGEKISDILEESPRSKGIIKICTVMVMKGLLRMILLSETKANNQIKSYTISERGLNAVMPFIAHISNKAYYG